MREGVKSGKESSENKRAALVVKALFELDRRIRYCAVIGEKGEEVVGGMRPGTKSLETERESSRLRTQTLIGMAINKNWNDMLGDADYIVVHRSKVTLLIFPLSGLRSLLVSAEPDYPSEGFGRIVDVAHRIQEDFR